MFYSPRTPFRRMRRCTMFAVLTCTAPAALGLAPGTWAGSRPRARRVVSVEAPPPAGFVWGYASDESEQLASTEAQLVERDAVPEHIPLEERGLPEWCGSVSLIDALVVHGMPGLSVADVRGLASVCKAFKRDMDDNEVWRLSCAALATQFARTAEARRESLAGRDHRRTSARNRPRRRRAARHADRAVDGERRPSGG